MNNQKNGDILILWIKSRDSLDFIEQDNQPFLLEDIKQDTSKAKLYDYRYDMYLDEFQDFDTYSDDLIKQHLEIKQEIKQLLERTKRYFKWMFILSLLLLVINVIKLFVD
ncbi:hypothetical protein WMC59_12585 [Staphylococcus delphini]|uniref:hypothetical protein n=1 Tax=Staphylococcus delphini TaxID=53344 RepID=UPI00374FD135